MIGVLIGIPVFVLLTAGVVIVVLLRKPSRRYSGPGSVSGVYDTWTTDQKMKFYWGNHLHAGFYGQPPERKDFIRAKLDMIDEMVRWGIAQPDPRLIERLENPVANASRIKILDVGSGMGGTALHLAQRWPKSAHITGITISSAQTTHATRLAHASGLCNVTFVECDAMDPAFAAQSFDIIWTLESEVHMPDKERFMREIVRVLKPGGWLLMGTWNVRDTRSVPLNTSEMEHVQYLLDEWCHTKFDEIHESVQLLERHGLQKVVSEDWTAATLPSWRDAILVALRDGRGLVWTADIWWRNTRDAYTILRFDSAFRKGLCQYGLFRGQKP
ncbi:MAG: methyltransferase domain-containing protein [Anaerolineae bacterium]|nr:methyltransferase domain-containing protein [Anaerolineae bacterium]